KFNRFAREPKATGPGRRLFASRANRSAIRISLSKNPASGQPLQNIFGGLVSVYQNSHAESEEQGREVADRTHAGYVPPAPGLRSVETLAYASGAAHSHVAPI